MNNLGVKSREPVIGDSFDLETYGRPSDQRRQVAARAKAPAPRRDSVGRRSEGRHSNERAANAPRAELAAFESLVGRSDAAPAPTPHADAQLTDNAGYEARLAEREEAVRSAGVRTVKIRGQATPPRRRPSVQIERYDQHPDRAAQWALFLGVFMVVVAIVTGS